MTLGLVVTIPTACTAETGAEDVGGGTTREASEGGGDDGGSAGTSSSSGADDAPLPGDSTEGVESGDDRPDDGSSTGDLPPGACLSDEDCAANQYCQADGSCVALPEFDCFSDADCGPGEVCEYTYTIGEYSSECIALDSPEACAETPALVELPLDVAGGEAEIVALAFVEADDDARGLLISRPDGSTLVSGPEAAVSLPLPLPDATVAHGFADADLDGDGDLDLLVALGEAGVAVLQGDGSGAFTLTQTLGVAAGALGVAALRFDDGDSVDVVTAGPGGVQVLFGQGGGVFGGSIVLSEAVADSVVTVESGGQGSVVAGLVDDVREWEASPDGDLFAEATYDPFNLSPWIPLVAARPGAGRILAPIVNRESWSMLTVHAGTGFQREYWDPMSILMPVAHAAAGDVDGDGREDFVLAGGGSIAYVRNAAKGPACQAVLATKTPVTALAVGDFNGDLRADVATADGAAALLLISQ